MNWELSIRKTNNGFIVIPNEDMEDNDAVFQYKNDEDDDLEAVQDMLYHILEQFGIMYSKHNKRNIKINIEDFENA